VQHTSMLGHAMWCYIALLDVTEMSRDCIHEVVCVCVFVYVCVCVCVCVCVYTRVCVCV
jgi:hypothetical protein